MPPEDGDSSQPLAVAAVELVAKGVVAKSEGMSAPIKAIKPKIISVQALPIETPFKPEVLVIETKSPNDRSPFFPRY